MTPQMGMNPMAGMPQNTKAGHDPDKLFQEEAENLKVVRHEWILEDVEDRIVNTLL